MVELGKPTGISGKEYGVLKRFEKIAPSLNNVQKILDIGCGYGAYTKLLKKYGKVVVGIDISQECIFEARLQHPELTFFVASGEFLPFKNESFEVVCLIEVLEHVQNESSFLQEIHRVLRPNGKLIITVPNKFFPFETHSIKIGKKILEPPIPFFSWLPKQIRKSFERARIYHPKGLKALLKKCNFKTVMIDYVPPVFEGIFSEKTKLQNFFRILSNAIFPIPFIKPLGISIVIIGKKVDIKK